MLSYVTVDVNVNDLLRVFKNAYLEAVNNLNVSQKTKSDLLILVDDFGFDSQRGPVRSRLSYSFNNYMTFKHISFHKKYYTSSHGGADFSFVFGDIMTICNQCYGRNDSEISLDKLDNFQKYMNFDDETLLSFFNVLDNVYIKSRFGNNNEMFDEILMFDCIVAKKTQI